MKGRDYTLLVEFLVRRLSEDEDISKFIREYDLNEEEQEQFRRLNREMKMRMALK
jgi:hypothetical protein